MQGGNKRRGRKTLTSPSGPTLSVLSMSVQMGEAETCLCTTNKHQPILGSLVSLDICKVPTSAIAADTENFTSFWNEPQ